MNIRKYQNSDFGDIVQCFRELQGYERTMDSSKKTDPEFAQKYLEKLINQKAMIFVAEEETNIAGFCAVIIEKDDDINPYAYITDIYIKPEYRRNKLGSQFIEECRKYAKDHDLQAVHMTTLLHNMPVQELLKNQGFSQYEVEWKMSV